MKRSELIGRLTEIFRDVFDNDEIELSEDLSATDVEQWDSLRHISLVLSIEKAFAVKFTSKEIGSFNSVRDLVDSLHSKVARQPHLSTSV
jgi:acyl carrier protein